MKNRIKQIMFVELRILKYKWLPSCKNISGKPKLFHPALLNGYGKIKFGSNVQLGVVNSPGFYSDYSYFEARNFESEIIIGNNVSINNNFSIEALSTIRIFDNVLIGFNCKIIDNDGHHLHIDQRNTGVPNNAEITIEKNVFLGDNVTVLKGVVIGENSVVGNGSIVTKTIPKNVIAAGNPAKVIKELL
jgi:galactoside O-acetyltransferase